MSGRRLRSRAATNQAPSHTPTASSTRPRRGTTTNNPASSAFIERSSPEEPRQSMNLTVKAPPNKLRKATSGNTKTAVTSRNIVSGKRSSRNRRAILEVDSDEEEEEEEEEEAVEPEDMDVDDEDDEEDPDAEGEEDEDDVDVDAEGEDDDEEMVDVAPAPRITVSKPEPKMRSNINVTPAPDITSVEAKEMAMADEEEEEELSELSEEEAEEEEEEEEEEGGDEDAEGEEDEEMAEQENDDDDDELDSDDETPQSMSRSHTPDLSKMTRRQRAMVIEGEEDGLGLMALSNEAQKKKHLTAEEHAMRRAEMARRRKNLSEKRNEEEKMDTINRLLKKQPPKRGRRVIADITESGQEDELEPERANPIYLRYTQNANGSSIAIPDEWLAAPVGSLFSRDSISKAQSRPFGGRMVEEVA